MGSRKSEYLGYVAMAKVQKTHTQIANARRDFLHKATTMLRRRSATTISQNHAVVFVEDLQVRNMSKSSAGTLNRNGAINELKLLPQ